MMKKNILILFIVAFTMASCGGSNSTQITKYDKNGLSFVCPKGWEIKNEMGDWATGHQITIEHNDQSKEGSIVVFCALVGEDPEIADEAYEIQILETMLQLDDAGKAEQMRDVKNVKFNGYPALDCVYSEGTVDGVGYIGMLYALKTEDKRVCIFTETTYGNREENEQDFRVFEESFELASENTK